MSEPLILLVVVSTAAVFMLSGVAKLGSPRGTEQALAAFRVPFPRLHRVVAVVLPVAELVLAAGLLAAPAPFYTVVAAAAVVLVGVFLALAISVLARGDRVVCACFGELSERAVGRSTLVRNTVLLAATVVALTGTSGGALFGLSALSDDGWLVLLAGATVLLGAALVTVVGRSRVSSRRAGRAARSAATSVRAETPGAEWPVPDVEITDPAGNSVQLVSLATERPVLLVLLSAECTPCVRISGQLAGWQSDFGDAVRIAVLTSATRSEFARAHPDVRAPVHYGYRALLTAAEIPGVPSALLLSTSRMVAAGPAVGLDEVEGLAAAIAGLVLPGTTAPTGTAARTSHHDDGAPVLTGPH